MAAQYYKINYKSDFVLTINSDAGWAVPFCIKFWTGMPSHGYFAGFDGENYVNCRVGDEPTQLLVMFDDHHMPVGPLRMQIAYHTTIEEFPDRKFDEVTNPINVTVDIDGTEYQVMLDFTGETGAEIDFSMPSSGVMSVNGKIGYVTLTAEDVGAQPTIEDLATIRSGAAAGATAVQPATLQEGLAGKQDTISDLSTIRSGAAAGATAVQPATLQEGLAGKQDTISDLSTIRSGAAAGATAVQPATLQEGLAGKQDTISDLSTIRSGAAAGATAVQPATLQEGLAGKQDTISDLSTIRSGAAAGATAYQKPGTGIPSTDLASAVQTSLERADEAAVRPYNTQSPDGMGYLVLDKDATFASQVTAANTIYEIRYDFILSANFNMPSNCILKFNGGSVSGAFSLKGANTKIEAGLVKIFGTDTTISGTWNINEAHPEWFGAVGDGLTDDSLAFNSALAAFSDVACSFGRKYAINSTVNIPRYKRLSLSSSRQFDDLQYSELTHYTGTLVANILPVVTMGRCSTICDGHIELNTSVADNGYGVIDVIDGFTTVIDNMSIYRRVSNIDDTNCIAVTINSESAQLFGCTFNVKVNGFATVLKCVNALSNTNFWGDTNHLYIESYRNKTTLELEKIGVDGYVFVQCGTSSNTSSANLKEPIFKIRGCSGHIEGGVYDLGISGHQNNTGYILEQYNESQNKKLRLDSELYNSWASVGSASTSRLKINNRTISTNNNITIPSDETNILYGFKDFTAEVSHPNDMTTTVADITSLNFIEPLYCNSRYVPYATYRMDGYESADYYVELNYPNLPTSTYYAGNNTTRELPSSVVNKVGVAFDGNRNIEYSIIPKAVLFTMTFTATTVSVLVVSNQYVALNTIETLKTDFANYITDGTIIKSSDDFVYDVGDINTLVGYAITPNLKSLNIKLIGAQKGERVTNTRIRINQIYACGKYPLRGRPVVGVNNNVFTGSNDFYGATRIRHATMKYIDANGNNISLFGTTANRPTSLLLANYDKGFCYFDTDLGKPVYYNGTSWVDTSATSVITQTGNTATIMPNVMNVWGEVSSLTITLGTPSDPSVVNEYMIQFTSGVNPTTLVFTDTIKWVESPNIEASAMYQISIVNGLGVIAKFV